MFYIQATLLLHLFASLLLPSVGIFASQLYSDGHPSKELFMRLCGIVCSVDSLAFHHVGNEANLTDKSWSISKEQTFRSAIAIVRIKKIYKLFCRFAKFIFKSEAKFLHSAVVFKVNFIHWKLFFLIWTLI